MHVRRLATVGAMGCLAVASCLLASCSTRLTESSARSTVEASESAWKQSRFDDMGKYTADDCTANSRLPNSDGVVEDHRKPCKQEIEQSVAMLKSAVANGATVAYDSTIESVVMQGDKAIAQLHVTDRIAKGEKSLQSEGEQTLTLQLRDGKILITDVVSNPTHLTASGRRIF